MRLISLLFYKELLCVKSFRNCLWLSFLYQIPTKMSLAKKTLTSKFENVEDTREMLVLELGMHTWEAPSIFTLSNGQCLPFLEGEMCEYLWERHTKQKWGRVGLVAYMEWKWHVASKRNIGRGSCRFIDLFHGWEWRFPQVIAASTGVMCLLIHSWLGMLLLTKAASGICPIVSQNQFWHLS